MPLKMLRSPDISIFHLLGHLLPAWAVIILVAQGLGLVFKRFKQPAVLGEICGGILLGPSFLGVFFPQTKELLFPSELLPWINGIAQLGIVFYMFLIGLELDWASLRRKGRTTLGISLASILFPFLLGLAFAGWAEAALAGESANRTHYALFVGVSMSVTAFPVLARILSDTGLRQTPMGNLALACAAINDAAAWCLLAVVISLAQSKTAQGVQTLVLVAAYLVIMFGVVRPFLKKASPRGIVLILILLAGSASVTAWIGIHAIFGAFLLGVILPRDTVCNGKLAHRAESWVRVFLLPVFFTCTGLRTQINLLNSPHDWLICAIVIVLATVGKLGGTAAAARWCGLRWRAALTLGVLMNTRGLVELIVLNAGYELNLVSGKLFTMLVVMALSTTLMTCPILHGWLRKEITPLGAI
jgi:Kef-type K+ transport system membrane component KefB